MTLGARTTNRPISRPVKLVLKTQATQDGADGPRLPLDPKAIGATFQYFARRVVRSKSDCIQ